MKKKIVRFIYHNRKEIAMILASILALVSVDEVTNIPVADTLSASLELAKYSFSRLMVVVT